jgi:hypothetical protein
LANFLSRTDTQPQNGRDQTSRTGDQPGELPFNRTIAAAALGTVLTMLLFWELSGCDIRSSQRACC